MKVFISYAWNDHPDRKDVLAKLVEKMPNFKDAELWDPSTNLEPGDVFRDEIRNAIKTADTYVLLWSKNAANSPYVLYEFGMASAFGIPITVVVLESSDTPDLPAPIDQYQTVNLEKAES